MPGGAGQVQDRRLELLVRHGRGATEHVFPRRGGDSRRQGPAGGGRDAMGGRARSCSADRPGGIGHDDRPGRGNCTVHPAAEHCRPTSPTNRWTSPPFCNRGFKDEVADDGKGGWSDQGPTTDLREFPTGAQNFGGVPFLVGKEPKCCIVLKTNCRPHPELVPGEVTIPVGYGWRASGSCIREPGCAVRQPGGNLPDPVRGWHLARNRPG